MFRLRFIFVYNYSPIRDTLAPASTFSITGLPDIHISALIQTMTILLRNTMSNLHQQDSDKINHHRH